MNLESVAICFNSRDKAVADQQVSNIDFSSLEFSARLYFSHQRSLKNYLSFSQGINEAIDDTDEEFMIFVNPKVKLTTDSLNFIVKKLHEGNALVAICGFSYFGTTKELIRTIGMLDENFLGGEFEDDDYLLRLRIADKKIHWGHDFSFYPHDAHAVKNTSVCPPERGCAYTRFWRKWRFDMQRKKYCLVKTSEKCISTRHSTRREDISQSWGKWQDSQGEGFIFGNVSNAEVSLSDSRETSTPASFKIIFSVNTEGEVYVNMRSDFSTAISYMVVNSDRKSVLQRLIPANHWLRAKILPTRWSLDATFEIRFYHDGSLIYINKLRVEEEKTLEFHLPVTLIS